MNEIVPSNSRAFGLIPFIFYLPAIGMMTLLDDVHGRFGRPLPTTDYTVFVHLLQPDGTCNPCAWQQDVMPQQGQYPTARWQVGEVVIDSYQIVLPAAAPPGVYPLEVGLYLAENGRRLQVTLPDGRSRDALLLQPIEN